MVSSAEPTDATANNDAQAPNAAVEVTSSGIPQDAVNGMAAVTLDVQLTKNAVVRKYELTVRAGRADWIPAGQVAQVRRVGSDDEGNPQVVIDFGIPRTVSGVGVVGGAKLSVLGVAPWLGSGFYGSIKPDGQNLFPEVVTQKLQISYMSSVKKLKESALGGWLAVKLPTMPGDLSLTIDGGAPVWRFPGTVQAADPSFTFEWTVDIGSALAKLTGDPRSGDGATFKLLLSARAPGLLELETGDTDVQHVARLADSLTAAFDAEGSRGFPFDPQDKVTTLIPHAKTIVGLSASASAKLGGERTLPPEEPAADPAGADLVVDPDHSACVRLPSLIVGSHIGPTTATSRLKEITAVRLPLRAGGGGAEARVVLLGGGDEPGDPIDGGTSKPMMLPETAPDAEVWTTFALPRPLPVDEKTRPWVAVLAGRGTLRWGLGPKGTDARRGPPTGPWRRLPSAIDTTQIGGRARVVGHASPDDPMAPLFLNLTEDPTLAVPATPSPKGTAVSWTIDAQSKNAPSAAVGKPTLRVTSLTGGSVTVRNVDVFVTTS